MLGELFTATLAFLYGLAVYRTADKHQKELPD